jgi:hypothetical protein
MEVFKNYVTLTGQMLEEENRDDDEHYINLEPNWSLVYKRMNSGNEIVSEELKDDVKNVINKQCLGDKKTEFVPLIRNSIEALYGNDTFNLARYHSFERKEEGKQCGDCCYRGCKHIGKIANRHVNQQTGLVRSQCMCDEHKELCRSVLIQRYEEYKPQHEDLDHMLETQSHIDMLYIRRIVSRNVRNMTTIQLLGKLRVLYSFYIKYINEKTIILLKELNGRIFVKRKCNDERKKHCQIDWGHLVRILILQKLYNRLVVIMNYINASAIDLIRKGKKLGIVRQSHLDSLLDETDFTYSKHILETLSPTDSLCSIGLENSPIQMKLIQKKKPVPILSVTSTKNAVSSPRASYISSPRASPISSPRSPLTSAKPAVSSPISSLTSAKPAVSSPRSSPVSSAKPVVSSPISLFSPKTKAKTKKTRGKKCRMIGVKRIEKVKKVKSQRKKSLRKSLRKIKNNK